MHSSVLINPEIIKRIFAYCPNTLATVKIHRLVCKSWKRASTLQWRLLTPAKIVQDSQHGDIMEGTVSICQFIDNQENHESMKKIFPQNYILIRWNIDDDHCKEAAVEKGAIELNRLFWSCYGESIKTLTLSHCTIPYNFTLIPPAFWKAVPNLENLSLLSCEMKLKTENYTKMSHKSNRQLARQTLEQFEQVGMAVFGECDKGFLGAGQQRNYKQIREELEDYQAHFPFIHVNEKLETMEQLRADAENLQNNLVQLRFLKVHNLTCVGEYIPIEWSQILNMFPYLETILLSQQEISEFSVPPVASTRKLKNLDLLNISSCLSIMPSERILRLPTERLSFDCGILTEREQVCSVLNFQADGLKELCLFRAQFEEPYSSFPCDVQMFFLTKLELWSNPCANLNFLVLMPNLTELKWNTCSYDENDNAQGPREYAKPEFELQTNMLNAESIVKNTKQLNDNFKLESLETFNLERGPLSVSSLRQLGKWLPNVKKFKATVAGDEELGQIGMQWDKLEHLELAQGSVITAVGVLAAYLTYGSFQNLKSFMWKARPSQDVKWGVLEMCAENQLKMSCGNNLVHPWSKREQSNNEI